VAGAAGCGSGTTAPRAGGRSGAHCRVVRCSASRRCTPRQTTQSHTPRATATARRRALRRPPPPSAQAAAAAAHRGTPPRAPWAAARGAREAGWPRAQWASVSSSPPLSSGRQPCPLRRTPSTRRQRTRCKSYPLSVAADTGSAQTRTRSCMHGCSCYRLLPHTRRPRQTPPPVHSRRAWAVAAAVVAAIVALPTATSLQHRSHDPGSSRCRLRTRRTHRACHVASPNSPNSAAPSRPSTRRTTMARRGQIRRRPAFVRRSRVRPSSAWTCA